jgi:hypothetical protein
VSAPEIDVYAQWDGAYALGALDAGERAEFEAHLLTCPQCRARVAEAVSVGELLAALGPRGGGVVDLPAAGPVPETLLPGLLRRASSERRRRRVLTASVAGLAAACLITLVVVLWPGGGPSRPPAEALHAVRATPVAATAQLEAKAWGTQIDVRCRYYEEIKQGISYDLRVVDTSGAHHSAGSWKLVPGRTIAYVGGTDVRRDRIAKVQITLADGTPILELDV